jgi:TolB-like protein
MRTLPSSRGPVWVIALALAVGACGCASTGPRYFVNPQADMSLYKKVAIMPFGNLSTSGLAGERVTRAFITELVITDRYRVVEPAEFRAVLHAIDADPSPDGQVDAEKLREAAGKVDVAGVIRGSVTDYEVQRRGQDEFPVVSFDVELLDVASGNIVWRASITRRGSARFPIIGGSSPLTLGALTQSACSELVEGLRKKAF